jgi:hypothetical protein
MIRVASGRSIRQGWKCNWLEEGLTDAEAIALSQKGPAGWKHIKENDFPED